MRWDACLALVLACAVLAACGGKSQPSEPRSEIERFGLVSSPADYPLVMSAIENANIVLADSARTFAPGWSSHGSSAIIPVFAVSGPLASREIMATYPECSCIVVQVGALDAWLEASTGTGTALLAVEPRHILSYMLLHEAGHVAQDSEIEDGTQSAVWRPSAPYNRDATPQKRREAAADGFAAEAVRVGSRGSGIRGLAAGELSMALSTLSWNLAAHRLLDEFGGTALREPSLFWDAGTSHPSLEWRILLVNDLIAGSETSRRLLKEFEEARDEGSDAILWQSPK